MVTIGADMENFESNRQNPIKFIPQSDDLKEEINQAKDSYAYWWFMCLRANDQYMVCCRVGGRGELAETYANFGNVSGHFADWWASRGRKIFREQRPLKKVTVIASRSELNKIELQTDRLVLEIPLTMRRQTVARQINLLLKTAYTGREVDIQKASTARVKFVKSKIRFSTIELLLKIIYLRKRYPKDTLAKIGERANIELDLHARTSTEVWDEVDEKRRMTIAVSRYSKQAKNLIDNAGRGIFPSIKAMPKKSVEHN